MVLLSSFSFWWCCLPSPPLGGAALPTLFCWVALLRLLLLLGGVAASPFLFGWCCVPSPPWYGAVSSPSFLLRCACRLGTREGILTTPTPTPSRKINPTRRKGEAMTTQDQEGRATPTPSRKVDPNPPFLGCGSPLGWCCVVPLLLFGSRCRSPPPLHLPSYGRGRATTEKTEGQGKSRNKGSDVSKENKKNLKRTSNTQNKQKQNGN